MTDPDQYLLESYEPVALLDEEHGTLLVQHRISRRLSVRKDLKVFDARVYRALAEDPVAGMPRIEALFEKDGCLTVIEEYVPGETVRSRLDSGRLFTEEETVNVVRDLCVILDGLHGHRPSIVHRDIKPSNVMLLPDGHAMLLDLNAATLYFRNKSRDTNLIGTYGYAAPEQYGFGPAGIKADLYALGVLMNEMLTGEHPSVRPAEGRLAPVIRRCIQIDAENRFQSADSLMRALPDRPPQSASSRYPFLPWLPPGFRHLDLSHMVPALFLYPLIFAIGLTIEINTQDPVRLWTDRILGIVCCLMIILISCNYGGFWEKIGIYRIRNVFMRILAVVFLDGVALFLYFSILYLVFR